ncbi:MAG: multiheme c-type cytochrome [Pseudomonadota bacterium]
MLEKPALPAALCLAALLCLAACSPFAHLTEVNNTIGEAHGPKAADCGDCHLEQFGEWQASAHAQAFANPRFQAVLTGGADESCLGCHVPDTIRTNNEPPAPRRYNRQDGVSCAACHLSRGAMTGPEPESALLTPHPVTVQPEFFRNSGLCGTCHTETFSDWRASRRAQPATPTCQECHMPQVVRTATKGGNLFAKALVAFEESRPTRRHTFGLAHLAGMPGAVRTELLAWQPGPLNILQLSITNTLPHLLPAGSFRSRQVHLAVRLYNPERTLLAENLVPLAGENLPPLKPGEQRLVFIRLAPRQDAPPSSLLGVELRLGPNGNQGGMVLAASELPLPLAP